MAQLNSLVVTGNSRFISDVAISGITTTMGPLLVNGVNGAGSYDEGIRINASRNGYASLAIGGSQSSVSGTADGQFWIGTNPSNASYKRKLFIAHNSSTSSNTYFYADAAGTVSPSLFLGTSGAVASGDNRAVTGGVVYTALTGGSARDNTKLPLAGGTMTGDIIFNKTGATDLTQVQMRCGANDYGRIAAGGTSNAGWFEIATADDGNEPIYARQYSGVYATLQRTATILDGSGNTSFPGKLTVSKAINELITGTGTAAQDKGSSANPRYFPALWTFNKAIATPSDGDTITIKIPVAGHDYGVFISLDNGTTYKPVGLKTQDNGRLTTHFANGKIITLVYDSAAVVDQVFAAAGANSRTNITGAWKVITSYLDGNTYDRTVYNQAIKAGSAAIVSNNIIVGKDGVYHHLKDGTAFDVTYPILHAQTNIAANATGSWVFIASPLSIGTTQSITFTAYLPVFIKGTLNGKIFTPVSTTPLTQTIPTSEDGYYYINIGMAYNTSSMYLTYEHKIYAYRYNQFAEITWNSQFASLLKPIAANTTTALSTWYIPSGCYQVWGQQFKDNRLTYTPSGGSATTVTDTGDWTMWLAGTGTTNTATFNMRIDGTYYGSFSGNLSGNASSATKATQDESGNNIKATYAASFSISDHTITLKNKNGASLGTVTVPDNNTLNTAGSTDTSSKIFLIGATSQAANPQTYSDNEVYATSGVLTTKSVQVGGTAATMQYNSTNHCIDFIVT